MSASSVSQRIVARLLRFFGVLFLPKGAVGQMIRGDLLEEYWLRETRVGRSTAWLWLIKQLPGLALHFGPGASFIRSASRPMRTIRKEEKNEMFHSIWQDCRYAWRTFGRNRLMSLSVVAILALGIGANTAIFSVVDAVLLSSLPYQQPEGLVRVIPSHRESASQTGIWSPPDFEDFQAAATAYRSIAGYSFVKDLSTVNLLDVGEPVRLDSCMVSQEFFSTLGSRPLIGRIFDATEMVAGSDRVAILSHALWQQRFEADPSVVGRSYNFDDVPFQIIGVMPQEFRFPSAEVQLWIPISLMTEDRTPRRRNVRWISMIARLKDGFHPARAQAEAETILQQLESEMIKTFWNLLDVDPGFETHGVYRMSLSAPGDQIDSFASITAYHRKMLAALEQAPGVIAVGGSKASPLAGAGERYQFTLIDADGRQRPVAPEAGVHIVTPGYFDALGIVMRQGRSFTTQDSAPAGVINSVLAEQFFPDGDVLERSLNLGDNPVRIVGVVESVHHLGIQNPAQSAVYLPHWYFPRTTMNFYVRMANPSPGAADAIREAIWSVNSHQPIAEFSVLEELVQTDLARPRFMTILMVTFAALAVALTALGIYGVVSYRVGQRTSELGIRLALGASRSSLLRLVVVQSMALCGFGVVAGLTGATWLSQFLSSLLYGVSATDLPVFGVATAIVLGISLVPAQRATRIDPIEALRCD